MICDQLADCLKNLKPAFTDNPCGDKDRCMRCVESYNKWNYMACQEKSSKYVLDKERAEIESVSFHVDGGMIGVDEHIQRCDYAFYLKDSERRLILIELKGKDSQHAIDQLSAMVHWDQIKNAIRTKDIGRLYGRIVCKRAVPQIYLNKQRKLQADFKRNKGNLKIMTRNSEEKYSGLDQAN